MNYQPDYQPFGHAPAVRFPELSPSEVARWSFAKAFEDCRRAGRGQSFDAGIEHTVSVTAHKLLRRPGTADPTVFYIPPQILARAVRAKLARRDLTAASASGGGYLVETEIVGVVDALRPLLRLGRLGAQTISGLRSNQTVVRQGGTVTTTWLATEATPATETASLSLGQVSMTPKTVSAYLEASRLQMLLAADRTGDLVLREVAAATASAVETAAVNGSGSAGQPLGLLNTPGVGSFNGSSITYANVLESQTDILNANALVAEPSLGYVTTPLVASLLANRQGFSTNAPLWVGNLSAGQLAGAPALSTANVPTSTLIAGDWSQMWLGEWGVGLEVRVNPYANFAAGIIGFAAYLTMDVAIVNPTSFSVATSVS